MSHVVDVKDDNDNSNNYVDGDDDDDDDIKVPSSNKTFNAEHIPDDDTEMTITINDECQKLKA